MANRPSNYETYSAEFKLKVVKAYLEDHKTYSMIAREFGLPDRANARRWVRVYQACGEGGLSDGRGTNRGRPRIVLPSGLSLEQENKWLKAENDYLKKLLRPERRDVERETGSKQFTP